MEKVINNDISEEKDMSEEKKKLENLEEKVEQKVEETKKKKNKEKKAKKEENKNHEEVIKSKEEKTESSREEKEEKEKFKRVKEPKKAKKEKAKLTEEDKKGKKKKVIVISIIVGVILIIVLFISTIFSLVNINNDKIMSGISISGIEVSGLSEEEAKAKLETIYNEKKEKDISIKYEEYENSLSPQIMEVNYNINKAVEEAYKIGRNENIFISNYQILFSLLTKKNIEVEMNLNEEVTRQTIEDIGANLPGIVIESTYAVEDDELIITKGQSGIVLNTDELVNNIKDRLKDIYSNEDYIEIPVTEKDPDPIDIDKIYSEVHKEPQDAHYTENPFTVYPEVEGIDFNLKEARKLLEEDKEEYVIKLTITKPSITLEQLGAKAFPDQLSTFKTKYDAGDRDRTTNLRLACQKINGKVIMPGETFSYNSALGPRTSAAGYKNAKIYEAGQVVDGLGGGICQISSTLYNSVLMADLEIIERRNHQFVTSYVGAGRDATVVYGSTDFKFKNTREYPIRIVASAENGIATVSIYGIKEQEEYTFTFKTVTVATTPFATQYVEDASLAAGTEKVKQKGANGITTKTYSTKMLNGKVISTKLLSTDTYTPMTKIVLRGTNTSLVTAPQENTTTTTEEPVIQTPTTPEVTTPHEGTTSQESQEVTVEN